MAGEDQIRNAYGQAETFGDMAAIQGYFANGHDFIGDCLDIIDDLREENDGTALAEALALLAVAEAQVVQLTADLVTLQARYDALVDHIQAGLPGDAIAEVPRG
jgi:hypothetical protein